MAPFYDQKPENAMQRANEFLQIGKPSRALETLQEVFSNKRCMYNSTESVLQPIMIKFLELCVELRKPNVAKEGLFQYRNIFQSVNVGSLETIIRTYLGMAEEKTENARQQSTQSTIDIDDLDNLVTPESVLLNAISGKTSQDRSDRTIFIPWVKFLWDSYCQCLDLLKNSSLTENLYHDIIQMTFKFCLKYKRKYEFRKLCNKLRKHLEDIAKLPTEVAKVSLSNPETQQLNLKTRLSQLDFAIEIEFWQEAHRAIEDVHELTKVSKRIPLSKTMATYYEKVAMVFWKMGNHLFHAAALLKYFELVQKMKKNVTQEELQALASHVLIATLAISLPSSNYNMDNFIETELTPFEKEQSLANLLELKKPPTRTSLIKDLISLNVISLVSPQLQDLYRSLETEFNPLLLCEQVQGIIKSVKLEENALLRPYIPSLEDATLVHLICQISQVYQQIEISRLVKISKFATRLRIERILLDCKCHKGIPMRINHSHVSFGTDLIQREKINKSNFNGTSLQSLPSEQLMNYLVNIITVLHQTDNFLNSEKVKNKNQKFRAVLVKQYHATKDQQRALFWESYKKFIELNQKEERIKINHEENERDLLAETHRQQALLDQKRLEEEKAERERQRALEELQQVKERLAEEKIQAISQTSYGQKFLKKINKEEIKKMDADQIVEQATKELKKEEKELQDKLKSQQKKVDFLERAKRLEEITLLEAHIKDRENLDEAFWNQQEDERVKLAIKDREYVIAHQIRLARKNPEKEIFLKMLFESRKVKYVEKLRDFETNVLAPERQKRLEERRLARVQERRAKWIKEQQEAAEEALRKQEEERLRLEEIEQKRIEELERIKKEEDRRIREEKEKEDRRIREEKEKEDRRVREEKEKEDRRVREENERLERAAALQKRKDEEIERRLLEDRKASKKSSFFGLQKGMQEETNAWRRDGTIASTNKRAEELKNAPETWKPNRFRDSWRQDHTGFESDDRNQREERKEMDIPNRRNDRKKQEDFIKRDDRERRNDRDEMVERERRDDLYRRNNNAGRPSDSHRVRNDREVRRDDYDSRRDDRDKRDVRRDDRNKRDVRRDDSGRSEVRRDERGWDRQKNDRNRDNGWKSRDVKEYSRRSPPRSKEAEERRKSTGKDETQRRAADDFRREPKRPATKIDKPQKQQEEADGDWIQVKKKGGRK